MAEVALVSDLHDDDVVVGVVPQLLQPALDILVRQVLGDVVHQESSDRTPVIPGDSRAEERMSKERTQCVNSTSQMGTIGL